MKPPRLGFNLGAAGTNFSFAAFSYFYKFKDANLSEKHFEIRKECRNVGELNFHSQKMSYRFGLCLATISTFRLVHRSQQCAPLESTQLASLVFESQSHKTTSGHS